MHCFVLVCHILHTLILSLCVYYRQFQDLKAWFILIGGKTLFGTRGYYTITKYHKIKLLSCSLTRMAVLVREPKPSCKQACCPNLAPPRAHTFLLGILKAEVLLHWGQRIKLWDAHHRDLKASSEQHRWLLQTRAGRGRKSPEGLGAQSSIAAIHYILKNCKVFDSETLLRMMYFNIKFVSFRIWWFQAKLLLLIQRFQAILMSYTGTRASPPPKRTGSFTVPWSLSGRYYVPPPHV